MAMMTLGSNQSIAVPP